jgi:hypothetical protein
VYSIALDAERGSMWGVLDRRAVERFADDRDPKALSFSAQGAPYRHGRGPIALAYCNSGGDGGAIAVVFSNKKTQSTPGAGQTYDFAGKPIGNSYGGTVVNPHAIACSSHGEVFVAADNGLLVFDLQGIPKPPPGALQALHDPIYGVLVAY